MALIDYVKATPQYLLPGHLLSRGMHALTRVRWAPFKNAFIDAFAGLYRIPMDEATEPERHAYEHFNAFFTRALRPGIRPLEGDAATVTSPVDGAVSQSGPIRGGRIVQAKGRDYSVDELVAVPELAAPFRGGSFATLYLSPHNYHRIHMPLDGRLLRMVHIPGRLFSVSPSTTRVIPRLFARNERVACLFETELGPVGLVMVGAVFVGSIETVWAGEITPPAGDYIRHTRYADQEIRLARGEELGRFNMGSTVILLLPGQMSWAEHLRPYQPVKLGQALAQREAST